MKLGFTGTRFGMTDLQKAAFRESVASKSIEEFHHGSCQGADVEAARIVRELHPSCRIVAHPGPDGDNHRGLSGVDDLTLEPKTHFARNRDIVNATDLLLATPFQAERQSRGGTWYTVDFAEKVSHVVIVIRPDGSLANPGGL